MSRVFSFIACWFLIDGAFTYLHGLPPPTARLTQSQFVFDLYLYLYLFVYLHVCFYLYLYFCYIMPFSFRPKQTITFVFDWHLNGE